MNLAIHDNGLLDQVLLDIPLKVLARHAVSEKGHKKSVSNRLLTKLKLLDALLAVTEPELNRPMHTPTPSAFVLCRIRHSASESREANQGGIQIL